MTSPLPPNGPVRREEKIDALRTLPGNPHRTRQSEKECNNDWARSREGLPPPTPDAASGCALQPRS
jgi:hypothetical protein